MRVFYKFYKICTNRKQICHVLSVQRDHQGQEVLKENVVELDPVVREDTLEYLVNRVSLVSCFPKTSLPD